jgi:four helix bundle protein
VAVPTNIAEGQARLSANEFHDFLGRARGSLAKLVEVETQLMIAQNLAYFTPEHGKHLLDKAAELGKILNRLIGAIRPAA